MTKDEMRKVAYGLKPGMTDKEFNRMWKTFEHIRNLRSLPPQLQLVTNLKDTTDVDTSKS